MKIQNNGEKEEEDDDYDEISTDNDDDDVKKVYCIRCDARNSWTDLLSSNCKYVRCQKQQIRNQIK